MKKAPVFVALLVSAFWAEAALCDGTTLQEKLISEDSIRTTSARLYSDILFRACTNGRRYPRSQIEKGFKRHASEMKLQLEEQGYRITPGRPAHTSRNSLSSANMGRRERSERRFGCFRRYWLDD